MPPIFFGLGGTAGLYARAIQRLFGLQRGPGVVSPEFQSSVDVFSRPELWALHGGSLMMGMLDGLAAGGAGNRSQVAIGLDSGAKVITIVERILFMSTTTELLYLSISQTALTNSTGNLVGRDLRRVTTSGGMVPCQTRIRTQNNAALANVASQVGKVSVPANNTISIDLDFILAPGWHLRIYPTADNAAIASQITFIARERPALDQELQGL